MPIYKLTSSLRKFKPFFFLKSAYKFSFVPEWIEGMTYNAWLWSLKLFYALLANHRCYKKCKLSKRLKKRNRKCRSKLIQQQIAEQVQLLEANQSNGKPVVKLDLITILKLFWERKKISYHIEESIPDYRNQNLITYSKQSIIMSALAIFLFRMGSGNKYDEKSHDEDEKYSTKNMAKFIDAPENRVPVIKTIEKYLKTISQENINKLMIAFFKDLQRSKFFIQHPQIMPGDFFLLAIDCVHTHTYDHPHHTDIDGNNDCKCCLKRIYNKGTDKEKIKWIHNTLVMSFIFFGGLKIPIYYYPIHAKQVVNLESASENNHKQGCELVAFKTTLPIIKENFPRTKMVLLLDGLYANKPVIRLANKSGFGYIIVRKEECLPLLGKECDERATYSDHKKNCVKKSCTTDHQNWTIEQKYSWFNSMYLGEGVRTNVLRFCETRIKEGRECKDYKCEWLFSWRLSANTCQYAALQARLRWEIEDVFNTLKNRGLNFEHDYSRDPRSCFNWYGIALFAFGIFELFRFTEVVKQRGEWPQSILAEKLLGQLLHGNTNEIFFERCLSMRIQFRYHFFIEDVKFAKMTHEHNEEVLNTG